jgi:hypothetical protein
MVRARKGSSDGASFIATLLLASLLLVGAVAW